MKSVLHSATPVLLVDDIATTMEWYERILGFGADPFPESPPYEFCILSRDEVSIFLQRLAGYRKADVYREREGGVWSAYLRMHGIQNFYDAVRSFAEVEVLQPLHRQPYGQTEFEIRDPNGYVLVFAEETQP